MLIRHYAGAFFALIALTVPFFAMPLLLFAISMPFLPLRLLRSSPIDADTPRYAALANTRFRHYFYVITLRLFRYQPMFIFVNAIPHYSYMVVIVTRC